jgi:Ca2+-binding EF-hand superfamily protein
MIDALGILCDSTEQEGSALKKLQEENFRSSMTTSGKETGENLGEHHVTEIIADSRLVHEGQIIVEDFAQYLMSK